ncbi:MAG: GntR family transcriptional regulator [Candidatus Azotimanducaceae bacterium]|jgi:GntR family transcriptional regulator
MSDWNDSKPIYLQLRQTVVQHITRGTLAEGEAVPSVRQVAADEKINPLTVSKAYQMLVDENLLEKRRGLGMFVREGAQTLALEQERKQFIEQEWPEILERLEALQLKPSELPQLAGGVQT